MSFPELPFIEHTAVSVGIFTAFFDIFVESIQGVERIVVTLDHLFHRTLFVDDIAGDENQQFCPFHIGIGISEKTAENGNLVDDRNGVQVIRFSFLNQTSEDHCSSVGNGHVCFNDTLAECGRIDIGGCRFIFPDGRECDGSPVISYAY